MVWYVQKSGQMLLYPGKSKIFYQWKFLFISQSSQMIKIWIDLVNLKAVIVTFKTYILYTVWQALKDLSAFTTFYFWIPIFISDLVLVSLNKFMVTIECCLNLYKFYIFITLNYAFHVVNDFNLQVKIHLSSDQTIIGHFPFKLAK